MKQIHRSNPQPQALARRIFHHSSHSPSSPLQLFPPPRPQITTEQILRSPMAALASATGIAGLGSVALRPRSLSSRVFLNPKMAPGSSLMAKKADGVSVKSFRGDWLRTDLNVIGFGIIGWLAPSSIPAINGNSLTGLFVSSIGDELAHWPTGPALTSPFWLWLVLWHIGLFLCLQFGQIGFKGRQEEYF